MFYLTFESKTVDGSTYSIGGGSVALKKKRPYNLFLLIVLCIIPPLALAYFLVCKKKASTGITIPKALVYDIIDTIGSLIA